MRPAATVAAVAAVALLVVAAALGCAPSPTAPPPLDDDTVEHGPCPALPDGVASGAAGALDKARTVAAPAARRVVLMGGGVEVDRASALFVDGAGGGDVLVLRASGSTESYTSYFATELASSLAQPAASVTTLLLDDPVLAAHASVLCHVDGAEALWLAGGDQADYLVRWPDALRDAIARAVDAGAAVGGTSAGAMAFGGFAFDAALGSVSSAEALAEPTAPLVSVRASPLAPAELAGVVVDTHFLARDREGRLLAFLDAALSSAGAGAGGVVGIGLDESTALVVDGGAAFRFLADDGAAGFVYAVDGPEPAESGALDLDAIRRAPIGDGDSGGWPLDFAALADVRSLSVVDGAVNLQ